VFRVEKITIIYWSIECIPRIWFVKVLHLEIITFVYWPIECTTESLIWMGVKVEKIIIIYWSIECIPRIWFVKVLQLEIITFMYWPIECTTGSLIWMGVRVEKIIIIYWSIECTPIIWLLRCCNLKETTLIYWLIECIPNFIYKIFTTWKHHLKNTFMYGRIECTQSVSFVMVFQFEITSFTYWSLSALENFDLFECFNLQELFACTLAN
jgi:hypothetical protein